MNKKVMMYIGMAALAILLALLLGGAAFLYAYMNENMDSGNDVPQTGNKELMLAPDFEMENYEGELVRLSDFRGKPVVLNFWASWCPPCKEEMPDFDAAYKKYGSEIEFIMLNATGGSETIASAKKFVEGKGYSFPVYFDTTYKGSILYGASSIPRTFFINAEGELVINANGMLNAQMLEMGISMIR